MSRTFDTAEDFKRSLEARLKQRALSQGRTLERERQLVVFERHLARLFEAGSSDVVVKGGLAIELRTSRARTTKDVDLRAMGTPREFFAHARDAGARVTGDFMTFAVDHHPQHPDINSAGMQYEGHRYRVQGVLAGKPYGSPFSVDVAFGEPIVGAPEVIWGRADLAFAGLEAPQLRVYPLATHIAEKLHAYTVPRPSLNSRVKDLPDIGILAAISPIDGAHLCQALVQTFEHRRTHPLPASLALPPGVWAAPYERMASNDGLQWNTLAAAHAAAAQFLDPVLGGGRGAWHPESWSWDTRGHVDARDEVFTYESMGLRGSKAVIRLRTADGTLTEREGVRFGTDNIWSGDRVRINAAGVVELVERGKDRGRSR